MRGPTPLLLIISLLSATAGAQIPVPRITANDNRVPAGTFKNNVLTLSLELRTGRWYPESDSGANVTIQAFAETGKAPSTPGPLIRVPEGAEVRVTLRNRLGSSARIFGLHTQPSKATGEVVVAAGHDTTISFKAGRPGTDYYWATTADHSLEDRAAEESQLSGAFIIDSASSRSNADRVFVLGLWNVPASTANGVDLPEREVLVINGKSWPYTERFTFNVGDTVRWRWLNPTSSTHPMHLHGFYYSVTSSGTMDSDTIYSSAQRRLVNTELMQVGSTMSMTWIPQKPGNWVFHCHFAFHVSGDATLEHGLVAQAGSNVHPHEMPHRMAGLVIGIHVNPGNIAYTTPAVAQTRNLRLLLQSSPKRFGEKPAYGFVLQSGNDEPKRDSVSMPGPTLLLKRGQPVRIAVVNHLAQPGAVHWHGIELESFPDGVPDWSGIGDRLMRPIAPNDSFIAEFTPPRSGTFIYHSHINEGEQINSGMYGAMIVVDDPEKYDTALNKIVLVGGGGPQPTPESDFPGFVNGTKEPAPMRMELGKTYRLRLINIHPEWRVEFSLGTDTALSRWTQVAKDGADLPSSQVKSRPAYFLTGPGETADFEFTPANTENLRLIVRTRLSGWIIPIDVIVTREALRVSSVRSRPPPSVVIAESRSELEIRAAALTRQ